MTDLERRYADDPDPGVHGAAEWTLRQLGAEEVIAEVRAAFASGDVVGSRKWYVTKTGAASDEAQGMAPAGSGLTMVVLEPGEFLMGSPIGEAERIGGPTG
jgi:hypothetical protein